MKGLIFTYLLTYGGALASLVSPFTGLLIYIAFAIIKPDAMWFWAVPPGNYSRIIALAMLVGWAIHGFGKWNLGRARGIVYCFTGYWIWVFLSTMNSLIPAIGYDYLESLTKVLLPFLVGMTIIESKEQLKQLAWVMVLSQGYVAWEMNVFYYFEGYNRIYFDGFAGMDNNSVAIAMVTGVGLAFFLAYGAEKWWQKAAALFCALLMVHAVMLSFSRGGLLALIIAGVISFVLIPKKPKHYLVFILVLAISFRLAGAEVVERFGTVFTESEKRDYGAQSRLDLWVGCWKAMLDNPVLGQGPDHWPIYAPFYGFEKGKEAHTLWLQTGAELGFPGVGFLLLFYILCIKRMWRYTREKMRSVDPWMRDIARSVVASIAAFMVAAQFVSLEGLELPFYVVLLGAGSLKLLSQEAVPSQVAKSGIPSRRALAPA